MAGTITYDVIGSRITAGESGNRWDRRYKIEGMLSGPSIPNLIDEAYALIPNDGTPAPAPIVNMFIRESSIDRIWCENPGGTSWGAEGVITYTTPTFVGGSLGTPDDNGLGIVISSVSSVEEFETDRDIGNTQITTTNDNVTMAHLARTFRVGQAITFQRVEVSNPRSRQDTHEGTLNEFVWNGYAAKTVLLQTLDWETDDQGASYRCNYTFVRRASWQFRAVHEDPYFPGRPIPGASGGAVAEVDILPVSDFGALNIVLPS